MQVDIQLIPSSAPAGLLLNRAIVVIDVLRATTVMVQALSQGAVEIIPVATVEEAFEQVKRYPAGTTLLGGERGSRRIEGFDLGNSPREYTAERVGGKRLILTTTNGTKAFHLVSSGKEILVGSFLNMEATAERCVELDMDLLVFPSGDGGGFSLEDTVCGGMLIDRILRRAKKPITLTDASHSARILYQRFENDLVEAFHLSSHGRDLVRLGLGDDLPYCAQIDISRLVPVFSEDVIRISKSA
ncbi:MAG: 2-phosphosulfolactate phosphatase [Syntrophaceae bacterium]|nr:2-phosphosulfolactate phosphatase [Syntrophaceae bacterium]